MQYLLKILDFFVCYIDVARTHYHALGQKVFCSRNAVSNVALACSNLVWHSAGLE